MHIAIDYTSAVHQGAGIGRYTRSLIRALAKLDSKNRYTLFVAGGWAQGDGLGPWPPNFRVKTIPLTDRLLNILWQRIGFPMPIQAITGPIDLFHSPDFVLPPVGKAPALLTVHDLSFLRVPQHFVPGFREYLERAVTKGVGKACHVLADSKSTRSDLIELMGVSPGKVTVIYPGVDARFKKIHDAAILAGVAKRYQLPEWFILGLGTLQPRKNFDGLVRAFHQLVAAPTGEKQFADLHLVICGGMGWMYEDTLELIKQHGLEGRVHLPGFVREEDLPALYSLAAVFAFPSWYEGFGLPVLEAQACGTPVVAASNSSLPEVVGEGGLLVDAGNIAELTSGLAAALTDDSLRTALASAGPLQAARFSWETAAHELLALYMRYGSAVR